VLELMRVHRPVKVSAKRPAIEHPLLPFMQVAADFARQPFSRLSGDFSLISWYTRIDLEFGL
jgi:hypothetical protein